MNRQSRSTSLHIVVALGVIVSLVLPACSREHDVVEAASKTQSLFEFHSNFWVNLHHVLYEQAARRVPRPDGTEVAPLLTLGTLDESERAAWDTATTYYYNELIVPQRDLLFDDRLRAIKQVLAQEQGRKLETIQLPAALADMLRLAAPAYRKHWWPAHDRGNQQLVATLVPQIAAYGPKLQQQLIASYHDDWPGGTGSRLRVDVVYFANRQGAYTSIGPPQITLASIEDERSAGYRKLELLFHEASHTLVGTLNADINASAERLRRQPEQLWHATLFFTTGEIVRRTLEAGGIVDYVPYAYYNGLFAPDNSWSIYARALEKHWQPYLSGSVEYREAVSALVSAMPAQQSMQ